MNDICVCVPTLNEEKSIGEVLKKIKSSGYNNILVIDGGSTDNTENIVNNHNVKFREQEKNGGKGAAMKEAFEITDSKIIVFLDGDDTYDPEHIDRLTQPIIEDDFDHVIGNRFNDIKNGAMTGSHQFGNRSINKFFSLIYKNNYKDILSGFRAIRKSSFNEMELKSDGFEIETELIIESVKNNHEVKVVPTSYYPRKGESKLSGFGDGLKIIKTLLTKK